MDEMTPKSGLVDEKPPASNKKLVPVFLCGTDFDYHIPGDAHGVNVYFSEDCLRKDRKCVNHGCGITRIYLDCRDPFIVQPEDWEKMKASAVSADVLMKQDMVKAWKDIFNSFRRAFSATKRYLKWIRKSSIRLQMLSRVPKHVDR